jgi:8-oxo-dGTP pyrophosphatase MutT (NUDIX family)
MSESFTTNKYQYQYQHQYQNQQISQKLGATIKSANMCNNCGKYGHMFHQCSLPVTSCGIIAFTEVEPEKYQFLMIRRKDGFGFMEFIGGRYSLSNIGQIQNIIDEMSIPEKRRILEESYEDLCKFTWGGQNLYRKHEETSSHKKFELLRSGVTVNDEFITLQMLVDKSETAWSEAEWEFPKGRRNSQEKDIECALREYSEETGYSVDDIEIIDNLQPFEETFIGSNYKAYKHKYYLAKLKTTPVEGGDKECMQRYQKTEVSKLRWATCEECLRLIRPYNVEKKQIIQNINAMLSEYRIY